MKKEELEHLGYTATKKIIDGKEFVVISSTRPRRESDIKEISDGKVLELEEIETEEENPFNGDLLEFLKGFKK